MSARTALADHSYGLPSPKKLKAMHDKVLAENLELKKTLKKVAQANDRNRKKIIKLEQLLAGLHERLCATVSDMIKTANANDILKELLELESIGKVGSYSEKIRKFALTLNFYSAQAYRFLRQYATLPHPRTLRQWATSVDGKPGFTEESLIKISNEVSASTGPIFGTLIFDEMAIKKEIAWDGKKVTGYVDFGEDAMGNDDSMVAKEVLVFMVTALNRNWKIPVGYCLVNSLSANVKQNLLEQYLRKLAETGINIVAVVCDGTATNRSVMEKLGVKYDEQVAKCWFPHPSNKEIKVFAIFDTAHMLKLARNLIAEKKILLDGTISGGENKIKWDYFCKLVELQEMEGLHAANKLRRHNIEYHTQKMKVALAAQTLSNSVANAMVFCKNLGLVDFNGCEATVRFIKMIDTAFDLLNSCHPLGKGTKVPIFKWNKDGICKRIDECINYFKFVKLADGTSVCMSNKKMALYGIILNLMSVKLLAETYVWKENAELKYILTRRTSQDHLELFFSSIRSRGGDRNNPNAIQFRSAYRKCLIAQIEGSQNGNCIESDTGLLTPAIVLSKPFSNVNSLDFDHDYIPEYQSLTLYSENVVAYIAGSIIRQVAKKIVCSECLGLLYAPDVAKVGLIKAKDVRNSLINPAEDVIKLFTIAEKAFRSNEDMILKSQQNILLRFQIEVLQMLSGSLFVNNDHLFTATEFGEETHYVLLVKLLLKHYFTCRIHHLCKSNSFKLRGKPVRQWYTKLIQFKGQ